MLTFFSAQGWQSWDLEYRPLIPEGMRSCRKEYTGLLESCS